jgi:anti-sigma regulatory factor (Ser/Thr protein kinase)
MEEGFSTATDKIREMGFGAGMGLPNIKRNSDRMNVFSEVGKGTEVQAIIDIVKA